MIYNNPTNTEDNYTIYRLPNDSVITNNNITQFAVDIKISKNSEKIFLGLFNDNQKSGVAVTVNQQNGEIEDVLNGHGIIGYLINSPLKTQKTHCFALSIEKYGKIYLPVININNESLLHPATYIKQNCQINAYAGSSIINNANKIKKENELLEDSKILT